MEFLNPLVSNPMWLFALLVLGIIALPGMDMALVMSSTLVDGKRSGWATIAGIVTGGVVHVAMSALGIGLLLQHSPLLFNLLLLAGGFYVAWMGWGLLRSASAFGELQSAASRPNRPLGQSFMRAVTTCLLNPKAYVFMLAVFPQFIRADAGSVASQAVTMGGVIAAVQIVVYGLVAQTAAGLRVWLRGSSASQITFARAVGLLLVATAVVTLWTGWRSFPT
jgi:threonine/homoserine/homoserine lactone efflux protein